MLEILESQYILLGSKLNAHSLPELPPNILHECSDALSHLALCSFDEAEAALSRLDPKEHPNYSGTLPILTSAVVQSAKGSILSAREILRVEVKRILQTQTQSCPFTSDLLLTFSRLAFITLRFAPNFFDLAREAMATVKLLNPSPDLVSAFRLAQCTAWQHFTQLNIDDALHSLNEAFNLAMKANLPAQVTTELLLDAALMLSQLQKFDDAVSRLREASSTETLLPVSKLRVAKILASRGRIDYQRGNITQAIFRLERAVDLYCQASTHHFEEKLYVMWILHASFGAAGKKLELQNLERKIRQVQAHL